MEISKGAIGVLAALCVAGGAGGAYVATRSQAPTATEAVSAEPTISPDPSAVQVDQSEGIVTDAPVAPRARVAATPPPAARPMRPATVPAPRVPVERAPRPTPVPQPLPVAERPVEPAIVLGAPEAEPSRPVEPPRPRYLDLVVAEDAVIGLQVESAVSSDTARVEDEVVARVTRDVRVGDRVAIPAGSKAHGEVTLVERGGRLRERSRLGVRFTSIVLADGTRVPIEADPIYREGDGPGRESAAKIGGGAIGGAIIGGILGGAKGAAIGSGVGAGAGTAAVMAGGRNAATLTSGSPVTIRLEEPATVTVEQE